MIYLKHYGLLAGLLLLVLAGCNRDTNGTGNTLPTTMTQPAQPVPAFVRTLNGASDMGPLALDVDGKKVTADLKFGEASDFLAVQ